MNLNSKIDPKKVALISGVTLLLLIVAARLQSIPTPSKPGKASHFVVQWRDGRSTNIAAASRQEVINLLGYKSLHFRRLTSAEAGKWTNQYPDQYITYASIESAGGAQGSVDHDALPADIKSIVAEDR
jgi:hypothetical protein